MPPAERRERVILAGASGFIGRATLDELRRRKRPVTAFARGQRPFPEEGLRIADLLEPASLGKLIHFGDSVIHAAPYVGRDAARSAAVNIAGTRNLVSASSLAGARHVIYVSTAAVYGMGPHRDLRPEDATIRPASVVSEHRRVAEEIVLDAGGTVVRPHLVYGVGDTWVIPALLAMPRLMGGLVNGGAALTSAISVETLARLLSALTEQPREAVTRRIFHAVDPLPTTVRDLVTRAAEGIGIEVPLTMVPFAAAQSIAEKAGLSPHQLDLAAADHWYNGDDLWELLDEPTPGGFALSDKHREWYADDQ